MGTLRKKIGLKFGTIFSYWFFTALFLIFAGLIQYLIFSKNIGEGIVVSAQYAVYVFVVISLCIMLVFYIKYKINIPIAIYEKGIFMKRSKVSIMYSEISTYYFTPGSNNKIKTLVIEKMNGDRFVFDVSYVGEDFVEYFQKDYIVNFTEDTVSKIHHGYEVAFGIMTGKQKTILKMLPMKSMAKNHSFTNEFVLTDEFFNYDEKSYKWTDINAGYDIQTGNIEIVDKNSGNVILNTYFTYVEKGEFPFNVIDYILDEIKNAKNTGVDDEQILSQDNIDTSNVDDDKLTIKDVFTI